MTQSRRNSKVTGLYCLRRKNYFDRRIFVSDANQKYGGDLQYQR
jgi:hypothetical protein